MTLSSLIKTSSRAAVVALAQAPGDRDAAQAASGRRKAPARRTRTRRGWLCFQVGGLDELQTAWSTPMTSNVAMPAGSRKREGLFAIIVACCSRPGADIVTVQAHWCRAGCCIR